MIITFINIYYYDNVKKGINKQKGEENYEYRLF